MGGPLCDWCGEPVHVEDENAWVDATGDAHCAMSPDGWHEVEQ